MLNGWLRQTMTYAPDDGAGGGGVAAPEAPVSPEQAANARIDAAVQSGMADDVELAGEPGAAPAAAGGDELDALIPENMPYRDAKKLRDQLTATRQRFKPFEDAFGGLADDQREAAVGAIGALGADAASIIGLVGNMHPGDRNMLLGAYAAISSGDPDQVAQGLATFEQIVTALRGDAPPAAPAGTPTGEAAPPAGAPDPFADDDPERPLTRAELDAELSRREEARAQEQAQTEQLAAIHTEMRTLGYDPEAKDPGEAARSDWLVSVAVNRTGGDLAKAHEIIQAERQKVIDEFVASKAANARPGQPDTGSSPSGTTEPSKVDPRSAAESRLDAHFGPDPRRHRL